MFQFLFSESLIELCADVLIRFVFQIRTTKSEKHRFERNKSEKNIFKQHVEHIFLRMRIRENHFLAYAYPRKPIQTTKSKRWFSLIRISKNMVLANTYPKNHCSTFVLNLCSSNMFVSNLFSLICVLRT